MQLLEVLRVRPGEAEQHVDPQPPIARRRRRRVDEHARLVVVAEGRARVAERVAPLDGVQEVVDAVRVAVLLQWIEQQHPLEPVGQQVPIGVEKR